MYASGAEHPLKVPCLHVMRMIVDAPDAFLTDAEVLQEILHRYLAIRRWVLGTIALRHFSTVMAGRIEPIYAVDVEVAGALASVSQHLQARDLIHLAVMRRLGVTRIVSADRGFDGVKGIERLDPMRIEEWRASVTA